MNVQAFILTFKAHLTNEMSYRFNYLAAYLLRLTQLLISLAVWSFIFSNHQEIKSYTWNEMSTYFALAMLLALLFYPGHLFDMQSLIRKGGLNFILIKPMSFQGHILAKFLANKIPILVIMSAMIVLLFFFLDINLKIIISPASVIFSMLTFALSFYFGLCLGALAFWLVEMWPIRKLFQGSMALLGGMIAPIDLLPSFLASLAFYTPFPYLGYVNIKVLQDKISFQELQIHFLMVVLWIIFFVCSFNILWKKGLRRYEAVNL
jgi:ABC-2 type transport system permease protein